MKKTITIIKYVNVSNANTSNSIMNLKSSDPNATELKNIWAEVSRVRT